MIDRREARPHPRVADLSRPAAQEGRPLRPTTSVVSLPHGHAPVGDIERLPHATAAVSAVLEMSRRRMWVGPPVGTVRRARELARIHAGDLKMLRAANVGLAPETRSGWDIRRAVGDALLAEPSPPVDFNVRDFELAALGLAWPRQRSFDLLLAGRLVFPLWGADGAVGLTGLALDGAKPRWRSHLPALGLRSITELVFSAGLDEIPGGMPLTVCADPAAAMKFRSTGHSEWPPVSAVIAPGSRQLKQAHAELIRPHVRDGVVDLFIDDENPKRSRQFTAVLEAGGLEVRNVLEGRQREIDNMRRTVAQIRAEHREMNAPRRRGSS